MLRKVNVAKATVNSGKPQVKGHEDSARKEVTKTKTKTTIRKATPHS